MTLRGTRMGVHLDPIADSAALTQAVSIGARWIRWQTQEWQWLQPNSSPASLNVSTLVTGNNNVYAAATGMRVIMPFLGVPVWVVPDLYQGNWVSSTPYTVGQSVLSGGNLYKCVLAHTNHVPPNATYWDPIGAKRFPTDNAGRSATAAAAVTFAGTLNPAKSIFELWNEPNIVRPFNDQGQGPTVFAQMVADMVDAVRSAYPTLPLMLGSIAARGDTNYAPDAAWTMPGFGLAAIDWLLANRPNSLPDLIGCHPYGFADGKLAGLDSAGFQTSDPRTNKGWAGHVQAKLFSDGLVARGFPRSGALLKGAGKPSASLVVTEYGEPSEGTDVPAGTYDQNWQQSHTYLDTAQIISLQDQGVYHPEASIRYTLRDRQPTGTGVGDDHLGDHFQDGSTKVASAIFPIFAGATLTDPVTPPDTGKVTDHPVTSDSVPSIYCYVADTYERLYTRDEQYPRDNVCRGVMVMHGAGGLPGGMISPQADRGVSKGFWRAIAYVLDARPGRPNGYTFFASSHGGPHTWGNAAAMTGVDADLALFQGSGAQLGGARPGKVALMGLSMGHCTAFNWAVRNPTKVAGVFGALPVSSLPYHYNGGIETGLGSGAWPREIETAYGLAANGTVLDATVKAQRDPTTRAAELATMPWGLYANADDFIVVPGTVDGFIAAKGGPSNFLYLRRPATGNHTSTAEMTGPDLLDFLDRCAW